MKGKWNRDDFIKKKNNTFKRIFLDYVFNQING